MIAITETTQFKEIEKLAHIIWREAYNGILADEQISLMLNDFYTPEALEKQAQEGHIFLMLKQDDLPQGFASYSAAEEDTFKIHKLYLSNSLRGKGAGRLMISHITDEVLKKGAKKLQLNVNRSNPSKEFYFHLGFEIVRSVDIPYWQFVLDDYILEKKI